MHSTRQKKIILVIIVLILLSTLTYALTTKPIHRYPEGNPCSIGQLTLKHHGHIDCWPDLKHRNHAPIIKNITAYVNGVKYEMS